MELVKFEPASEPRCGSCSVTPLPLCSFVLMCVFFFFFFQEKRRLAQFLKTLYKLRWGFPFLFLRPLTFPAFIRQHAIDYSQTRIPAKESARINTIPKASMSPRFCLFVFCFFSFVFCGVEARRMTSASGVFKNQSFYQAGSKKRQYFLQALAGLLFDRQEDV